MKIDTTILVPVSAVVASVLLLVAGRMRIFELLAVIASGIWLALQLGCSTGRSIRPDRWASSSAGP